MGWSTSTIWNSVVGIFGKRKTHRRSHNSYARDRRLGFEQIEDRRMLAVFTVNSMLDNGDGANTTLRAKKGDILLFLDLSRRLG